MSGGLKKRLKLIHVFSIAAGAMISSGIFILPGIAFTHTGPSLFISYGIAGLIALVGVLSIIELSTAMPKAGGAYFFIGRTFGPLMGTITGTISWAALSLKSAFAVFGLSEIIYLISGWNPFLLAVLLTVFFVILNLAGIQGAAVTEVILVTAIALIMIAFIIGGFFKLDLTRLKPFFRNGVNGMFSTSAFVFVSFGGLLQIATIAEEVVNPGKDIRRGTLLAVISVTFLYMAIVFVTTALLDAPVFSGSLTPVADAAAVFSGQAGWVVISAAAAMAFITTGVIIILSLTLNLDFLVKTASAVFMMTYILANVAVVILRESRLVNYKPLFSTPLYPLPQVLSVTVYLFLLADMGWQAFAVAIGLVLAGFAVYFLYGRKKAAHDFALVHLLKRIVDSKWQDEGLDRELLEIVENRDRIDISSNISVINNIQVYELPREISELTELWRRCSADLADQLNIEGKVLETALSEREKEFSTALTPFTAIPHVVISGNEEQFAVVSYRSKNGIKFSEKAPNVHAVFVCIGTGDVRHLHLEVLAAVARFVNTPEYEYKWMGAESVREIQEWIITEIL